MTSITVSRGSESVTMDVYEQAGNLHIARDVGKPESRVYMTGAEAPKASDTRAPMETYTVIGQLVGPGAYADARTLAEDIVLPHSGGTSATLDLSNVSGLSSESVAFIGERPVAFGYPPGQGEWVSVQLQATVVTDTLGGTGGADSGGTPGSGTGPVTLSRGGTSITLSDNIDLERTVGRPANKSRHPSDDDPYVVDRRRAYMDSWDISGLWRSNAATNQSDLLDTIIKPPLKQDALTLDFNGVYGLGSYTVHPVGSQSARVSWLAGETGMNRVETLKLITIDNS